MSSITPYINKPFFFLSNTSCREFDFVGGKEGTKFKKKEKWYAGTILRMTSLDEAARDRGMGLQKFSNSEARTTVPRHLPDGSPPHTNESTEAELRPTAALSENAHFKCPSRDFSRALETH